MFLSKGQVGTLRSRRANGRRKREEEDQGEEEQDAEGRDDRQRWRRRSSAAASGSLSAGSVGGSVGLHRIADPVEGGVEEAEEHLPELAEEEHGTGGSMEKCLAMNVVAKQLESFQLVLGCG